jgi:copper homeostasis protein (lipoprotein)
MNIKTFLIALIPVLCCLPSCKTQSKTVNNTKSEETGAQKPENKTSVADNSLTSVDWPGIYTGNLPCADCEGIQTMIELHKDRTFIMQKKHTGKSSTVNRSQGNFEWNSQGSFIKIKPNDGTDPELYQVGENMLVKLDDSGKKIEDALENRYKLFKTQSGLTEKYWKLTELYGKKIVAGNTFRKEPHIILKNQENRVNGHGGCNTFFGSYELKPGNIIKFSQVGSTQMACPELDTETSFLKALQAADNYTLNGDTLKLNKAGSAPLARFEAVYLH